MNPTRAPSFVPQSRSPLARVPEWPVLPSWVELDRVIGVDVDSRGFIYLAHRGEHPLLCLHPDGRFLREVGAEFQRKSIAYDLRGPVPVPMATRYWMHGLHIDPWDNVWITDVSRHLVMKFDRDGALKMVLGVDGERGDDAQHFAQPTHVCVIPSGEFFVTDGYGNSRVIKFSASGRFLMEWGKRGIGPGEFHTPHVITLGDDGFLYVSDRENDRIQIFDQDGGLRGIWPNLHSVDGLFAAPKGSYYGSVGVDHMLIRLDGSGRVLDAWADPGVMKYPHAIACGADGALYVADSGDDWVLDPATAELPRREYRLAPREGGEGSRLLKYCVE